MCSSEQIRFRLEEHKELSQVTNWVVERLSSGYDLHWDLTNNYSIWVCVPGNNHALEEFLARWGNIFSADSGQYGRY